MTVHHVHLMVNGSRRELLVEPRRTLADLLREDLGLTGTHIGCEHGVCGACTVLVDGLAVRSCLIFGVQADDAEVVTIEGAAEGVRLHPVQEAFLDSNSFQCGFCTPGFVMTTIALLGEGRDLTEQEIRIALSGNLCRCTGYQSIVAGAKLAAERMSVQEQSQAEPPQVDHK
jgi:carbon-monoxide dehydrogenase small subunit